MRKHILGLILLLISYGLAACGSGSSSFEEAHEENIPGTDTSAEETEKEPEETAIEEETEEEEIIKEPQIVSKTMRYLYTDDSGTDFLCSEEYAYDEAGNLVKYTCCKTVGFYINTGANIILSGLPSETVKQYEYDNAGNMTKDISFDSEGNISGWEGYEYNDAGYLLKSVYYHADGTGGPWLEYEYDESGNLVLITFYSSSGAITSWDKYTYDEEGNMAHEERIEADGSLSGSDDYEYDASGNMIQDILYDSDGNLKFIFGYEYDPSGNLTTATTTYPGGETVSVIYEYDMSGNQTKESHGSWWYAWEYDENGVLLREIAHKHDSGSDIITYWYEYEYITDIEN